MKAEELRAKSKDELKQELLDLKKQQFNLRFQLSQDQVTNTAQIRTVRRDIARLKTVMAEDGTVAAKAPKKPAAAKKAPAEKAAKKTTTKKAAKSA